MLIKGLVKLKAANLLIIRIIILITLLLNNNSNLNDCFPDNFEAGTSKWNLTGVWGTSAAQYNSGLKSIAENHFSNYTNLHSSTATITNNHLTQI